MNVGGFTILIKGLIGLKLPNGENPKSPKIKMFRNIITMPMVTRQETTNYVNHVITTEYGSDPTTYPPHVIQYALECGLDYLSKKFPHQFITVALPTENYALPYTELKNIITNLNYKYLDGAFLTVEMFSGELKKENLHIHILKKGIYNKTKLIRDLSRKFKVAVNFVNIKKGTKESDYINRRNYLNGEKQSELKKENSEKDKLWRTAMGFAQIYCL